MNANKEYQGKWQATAMDCDKCGYEWAAVHPVVCEYLECPICHSMTPAPLPPEVALANEDERERIDRAGE
jgi:hypothetical protein